MLPGIHLPPGVISADGLLTIQTSTVRATDFRNHPVGSSPRDWDWDASYPLSITDDGAVSGKCLQYSGSGSSYALLRWLLSFESDAPSQEVLLLAETLTTPSGGPWQPHFGPLSRCNEELTQYAYSVLGRNNSGNRILTESRGLSNSGDIDQFGYSANTKYWIRLRVEQTGISLRVWPRGTSEPGSWTISRGRSTSQMPNVAGHAGVVMGSYSVSRTHRIHYIAHRIDGGAAPLPSGE